MTSTNHIVEAARRVLESKYSRTCTPSKYIDAFNTKCGRQIAIERNRQEIFVWTEPAIVPAEALPVGPVRKYPPNKSRNSNLNTKRAPRLRTGNSVWYWRLESIEHFQVLVEAYD